MGLLLIFLPSLPPLPACLQHMSPPLVAMATAPHVADRRRNTREREEEEEERGEGEEVRTRREERERKMSFPSINTHAEALIRLSASD